MSLIHGGIRFLCPLFLVFFMACASAPSAHAFGRNRVQDPIKVMPFGDSLTEGGYNVNGIWHSEGGYRVELWKDLLAAGYHFHLVGSTANGNFPEPRHEGHSGWRIDEVDAHSTEWVQAVDPDYILLMIGTNDCVQNYQFDEVLDRYETLLAHLRHAAPAAHVFVASLFHSNNDAINARIDQLNDGISEMAIAKSLRDPHLHYVDFSKVIGPSDLIDGIHPGPAGYDKMGKAWFQTLRPFLP